MARTARQFPQGKFTLRTPRQTKNGQVYIIYIYYYWQGRQLRRSTDLSVNKRDWNQDANNGVGELRSSYGADYQERNIFLQKFLRGIDSQIIQYVEKHGNISCKVHIVHLLEKTPKSLQRYKKYGKRPPLTTLKM